MSKKEILGIVLVLLFIFNLYNIIKPYSFTEMNLGTVYYQSYSNLRGDFSSLAYNLDSYMQTKDEMYLYNASNQANSAKASLTIFKLAHQNSFRDTIINQKVEKPPITQRDVENLHLLLSSLRDYIVEVTENRDPNLKELRAISDIVEEVTAALDPKKIGYDQTSKTFRIKITDEQYSALIHNIEELEKLLFDR